MPPKTRTSAAVPQALVAADLDLATDVGRDLTAEVTLELVAVLEVVAKRDELGVTEVAHPQVRADARGRERLLRARAPDAVDVGERHLEPLVAGEVDADETCHVPYSWDCSGGLPHSPPACCGPRPPDRGLRVRRGGRAGSALAGLGPGLPGRSCCPAVLLLPRGCPQGRPVSPDAACGAGCRRSPSRDRAGGSPCTCRRSS